MMTKTIYLTLFFTTILSITLDYTDSVAGTGKNNEVRSRTSFNKDWLYTRFGPMPDGSDKAEPVGMDAPEFDDSSWRKVNLPHDWGIEGPFRMDLPNRTGRLPWAGTGWYRKHFTIPAKEKGKLFFIDFDGAMSHARVWLNGQYLGEWPYGYASFRLEMTPYLKFGEENILAVRLENPPNSSRWYPGSGLYRNVWLVKTSPIHIAHWGTFVTTPQVSKDQALIKVKTSIDNQSSLLAEVTVQSVIYESGTISAVTYLPEVKVQIPAGKTEIGESEILLPSPKLWDLNTTNLYDVETSLKKNNQLIDIFQTTFGIRTVEFTPDNGLLLNGERVRVQGVCNHHDLGLLGAAVNVRALERQIEILQEMGCNAIRTSHNPPAPELLDLCDRMGILVLDEAFDCWEMGKTPNDYSTLFNQWHEKDIRALVQRDRNHPCVIAWSSGNEIQEQDNAELSQKLTAIFHSEDPTRPVTAGCDNSQAGFNGFQNSVDVFGYNYKPHLYTQFHEANPEKPLWGTETASCVSSLGEYFFPVSDEKSHGFFGHQVSSYDLYAPSWAYRPDVEFAAQDINPSVAGEFVWTGFDYLGEPTPFQDDTSPSRSSYFGIVDLCGFKKDRFYLYQAKWRPELPMVHILPHWNWPDRLGKITPVHVYTSGDEAELFLNGASLGRKKKETFQYRLCWDDVTYQPGELKVTAYKNGNMWASAVMQTTGVAENLELSADHEIINSDGLDLSFITVRITDKDGLTVPTANNLIRFRIEGAGRIEALGNGDATCLESFQASQYKAFHGLALVIIRSLEGKQGPIRLIAESEGMKAGSIEISAK